MRRSAKMSAAVTTKAKAAADADPVWCEVQVGMLVHAVATQGGDFKDGVVIQILEEGVVCRGVHGDFRGLVWATSWGNLWIYNTHEARRTLEIGREAAKESTADTSTPQDGEPVGAEVRVGMLVHAVVNPNGDYEDGVVVEVLTEGIVCRGVSGASSGEIWATPWSNFWMYGARKARRLAAVNLEEAAGADDNLPVKVGDTVVVTTPQGLLDDAQVLSIADDGCFARTADGEVAGFTWDLVDIPARPELVRADMEVRLVVNDDACETGTVIELTEQGVFVRIGGGQTVSATWDEVELSVGEWLKHRQQAGKADANLELAAVGA